MGKLFQFKRQTAAEAGNCRRWSSRKKISEEGKWSEITGK